MKQIFNVISPAGGGAPKGRGWALVALTTIILTFVSCQNQPPRSEFLNNYNRADSGLYYQFHTRSHSGETVQVGNAIFAVVNFYWCDERIVTEQMDVSTLWLVDPPLFEGDLSDAFLMMDVGDSASFVLPADRVVIHWGIQRSHLQHLCDYFRITVRVDSIDHTFEGFEYDYLDYDDFFEEFCEEVREVMREFEREEARRRFVEDSIAEAGRQALFVEETRLIQEFLRQNRISAEVNSDGVFVEVVQQGRGRQRVREGRAVIFDYTVRSLTGQVFDSSCEEIAYYGGVITPWRHYQPQEIIAGERRWIPGLDNALIGQRVGTKLRVFIPSRLFATHGNIRLTAGYQPVVIDIEILEVR